MTDVVKRLKATAKRLVTHSRLTVTILHLLFQMSSLFSLAFARFGYEVTLRVALERSVHTC